MPFLGTPLPAVLEVHELIGAALLLASEKAGSFITGHEMVVDGGYFHDNLEQKGMKARYCHHRACQTGGYIPPGNLCDFK